MLLGGNSGWSHSSIHVTSLGAITGLLYSVSSELYSRITICWPHWELLTAVECNYYMH